jgi:hypothetical protein
MIGVLRPANERLDEVIGIASRLSDLGTVSVLHVSVPGRLTADELERCRRLAEAKGVTLKATVDGLDVRTCPLPDSARGASISAREGATWRSKLGETWRQVRAWWQATVSG